MTNTATETDILVGSDYTIIAEARGQQVLWYRQFGSYLGTWLLFSKDENFYYIYEGYYGSCSGCDDYEATFDCDSKPHKKSNPEVQKFVESYKHFIEMSHNGAIEFVRKNKTLEPILPKNAGFTDDMPVDTVGRQLALIVLKDFNELTALEILEIDNMEFRREALEQFGAEQFVAQTNARLIDEEGPNSLMAIDGSDFFFLYLQDSSTPRKYILRVAPTHNTVRGARAASFGMSVDKFDLVKET